jgi:hypothetical protein
MSWQDCMTSFRFVMVLAFVACTLGDPLARGDESNADSAPTFLVDGSVVMPDGKSPAVGADVHLLRRSSGSYTLPVKTRKIQTDQQGKFSFKDVAPGRYKVWAETPLLTTLKKKLGGENVTVGGKAVDLDPLTLHEGCNYRVKVISAATGKPLPSGRVWFGWTDLPREYRADKQGVVEIGGLGVDDWYFVVAADDHGIQFKKTPKQPLGSTTELTFKLGPGGDLVGVVRTDQGDPIGGANVSASSTEGGMTPGYGRLKTDASGRFRLRNLPAGVELRISAGKKEHVGASKNLAVAIGEKETTLDLICKPRPYGGDCIVTVLDPNGDPIAGAAIQNAGNSTADHRDAVSDATGQGRLANLFASYSGHRVFVRAKGYIPQKLNVDPGTADDPSRVTVTLQSGKTLRGQVLTPEGKAAPRVRVYYNEGEHPWSLGGRVDTDAKGKFEIDGLPEQSTLTVYTPSDYAPINDLPVTAGTDEPLTITMQLAAVLRVRAIDDETGKPIPEFNVRIRNSPDRQQGDPWGSFSTSYSEQGINILGKKKEFLMEHLAQDTPLMITVSAKGYLPVIRKRVLAVRSDRAKLMDVALEPDSPNNYEIVGGTLTDDDGGPISGAIVKLIVGDVNPVSEAAQSRGDSSDQWRFYHWDTIQTGDVARSEHCLQYLSTATDAKGRFQFDRVAKRGSWIELIHQHSSFAPARFSDLRGTYGTSISDLRLGVKRPATVKLTIDRQKWPEAHSVQLGLPYYSQYPDCLNQPYSSERQTIEGDDNEVKFSGLPGGQYRVTVTAKPVDVGNGGFRTVPLGSYFIDVPAGEDLEGDL